MPDWEIGFGEDLAHVPAVAGAHTQEAIERVARVWQPMVRVRLLQMMSRLAAEIYGILGLDGAITLTDKGDDIVLSRSQEPQQSGNGEAVQDFGDSDARNSLRISASLKERITAAASAQGVSGNHRISRGLHGRHQDGVQRNSARLRAPGRVGNQERVR